MTITRKKLMDLIEGKHTPPWPELQEKDVDYEKFESFVSKAIDDISQKTGLKYINNYDSFISCSYMDFFFYNPEENLVSKKDGHYYRGLQIRFYYMSEYYIITESSQSWGERGSGRVISDGVDSIDSVKHKNVKQIVKAVCPELDKHSFIRFTQDDQLERKVPKKETRDFWQSRGYDNHSLTYFDALFWWDD